MSWEFYESKGRGGRGYPDGWKKYPAVAFGRTGFSFNELCQEAFGIKPGVLVLVGTNSERRSIGIKIAPPDGGLTVQANGKSTTTARVACKAVAKRFPDCWGHAYRAHLNAGERIIEVELSPDNMLR